MCLMRKPFQKTGARRTPYPPKKQGSESLGSISCVHFSGQVYRREQCTSHHTLAHLQLAKLEI